MPEFRKDPVEEEILFHLNANGDMLQRKLERQITGPGYPVVLILGPPRSGGTLLSQVLASRLDVGYCSNLMARFYRCPSAGAYLQKRLLGPSIQSLRVYRSRLGKTTGIAEPNEFGYFWTRHLRVADDVHEPDVDELRTVDVNSLSRELGSITRVFGKPAMFKSVLCNYFIPVLNKIENVVFLDLKRDNEAVLQSVLRARRECMGTDREWWSLRPRNYRELRRLAPEKQVEKQVESVREAIESGLAGVRPEAKLSISYKELVADPEATVGKVQAKMEKMGFAVSRVGKKVSWADRLR